MAPGSERMAAMIALGEEIALCSSGQEETPESGESAEADQVQQDQEPLSEAAEFLGITSETLSELKERAKELKIDPHFFS